MHKTWDAFFLCINFKRWYKIVRKCDTIEIGKIDYNFMQIRWVMNIKVQLCGIVLLLIGFLLYYPKKKLQTS